MIRTAAVALLPCLAIASCSASAHPSDALTETCLSVGTAVIADVDWSADSESLAVLLRHDGSEVSVRLLDPAGASVIEVARFVEEAPASVSAGPNRSLYWQERSAEVSTLYRKRSGGEVESWILPALGIQALEATSIGLIGTTLLEVGSDADVLEVVRIELHDDSTAGVRSLETIVGLRAFAVAADETIQATSSRREVGDSVAIDVSGRRTWSAALTETTGSHIALGRDGSAVLFVNSTDGMARWVDSEGRVTLSGLGTREVLAIDVSEGGVMAAGSRNITGGDGTLCTVPDERR